MEEPINEKISRLDTKLFQKYEQLKLYCGKVVNLENIVACIIKTMKLLKKSTMEGKQKKETVIALIKLLIEEFANDEALKTIFDETMIGNIVESVYFEFSNQIKNSNYFSKLNCIG